MRSTIRVFLLLALLGFLEVDSLAAQQSGRGRVPVTIVLMEQLPHPDAPFVILRRAEVMPHDVIVLSPAADAAQLTEAIQTLVLVRQQGGDRAVANATLRSRPRPQDRAGARPVLAWAPRVLASLRAAQRRPVPGVGSVQAVEVWLPRRGGVPRPSARKS